MVFAASFKFGPKMGQRKGGRGERREKRGEQTEREGALASLWPTPLERGLGRLLAFQWPVCPLGRLGASRRPAASCEARRFRSPLARPP